LIPTITPSADIDTETKTSANDERLTMASQKHSIPAPMNPKPIIHAAIL
jgi:hypothetical protein